MKNGNAECKTIQSNTDYEKRKVFIAVTLCMACAVSIGLNTEKKTDGLLLMNIEALASGEIMPQQLALEVAV